MKPWTRLLHFARHNPEDFAADLFRWVGIVGFLWFVGPWPFQLAAAEFQDRGCTHTVAQRIALPHPHRAVEALIHRCPRATPMRPQLRWEAWAVSTEPGKEGRRLLISLAYDEAAPPRLRQGDASTAVIDRFRIADVLDWQQGRGEGFVPTDFLFLDDLGVERRLP